MHQASKDVRRVARTAAELGDRPRTAPAMPLAERVLMIPPTHFNIDVAINAHMRDAQGRPHRLDKDRAQKQWRDLKAVYEKLGLQVVEVEPTPGCPDMTFAANQSLPYVDAEGQRRALLSNMADDVRHKEVPAVAARLESLGYLVAPVAPRSQTTLFEGMGDALWLPGRRFLCGGWGFRTRFEMYAQIAALTGADVAAFELKNPRFYHLDTCLSVLDAETALACLEAFTPEGRELLRAVFPKIVEAPDHEADSPGFACNAHCPDQKHVVIQKGCRETEARLTKAGFSPVPVETDEFIKSGGSVFCLKLMLF